AVRGKCCIVFTAWRSVAETTKCEGYAKHRVSDQWRKPLVIHRGGVMKFQFKKLSGLIAVVLFALTATTTTARTFRSADVHAKDDPTNMAANYMRDEPSQATGRNANMKAS